MTKKFNDIEYEVGDSNIQNSGELYKVSNRWRTAEELFWSYSEEEYKYIGELKKNIYVLGHVDLETQGYFFIVDSIVDEGKFYFKRNMHLWKRYTSPYDENKLISAQNYAQYFFKRGDGIHSLRSGAGGGKRNYDKFNISLYSYKDLGSETKVLLDKALKPVKSRFNKLENLFRKSVGIEFETGGGHLPEQKCFDLGLIPFKDGSISGHEYVTVPYRDNVIERTVQACTNLRYHSFTDQFCSTHVHIGGLRTDRTFITSLYELWSYIQDEFYELIVVNKKSVQYLQNKKGGMKDHCKSVPKLNMKDIPEYYKAIFMLFNSSIPADKKFHRGKLVHDDAQKWNIDCRYYNLNMINLLNGRDVVEFRIHGPTLNEVKLVNYLLILNAVIEFASKYSNIIMHRKEKLYLEKIISIVYKKEPEIAKTLINYINHRKNLYVSNIMNNEIWGDEIYDYTPPDDCNILKLFDYSMSDNEYEKTIEECKKESPSTSSNDFYSSLGVRFHEIQVQLPWEVAPVEEGELEEEEEHEWEEEEEEEEEEMEEELQEEF
jgi:hypothetical protein